MNCVITLTQYNSGGIELETGVRCDLCNKHATSCVVEHHTPTEGRGKLVFDSNIIGYYCMKHIMENV